ncbi:hypothetical protein QBC38DRAFT_548268 [Podospora fimiseda]|uniref:Uncharacterized protein n=1 Tax=Podospora fimiseda TaxID=252190 RepID=A0AAN7GSP7_9PEZI|nr:hypothetical protein QBC38DRAFT_548268 [Podospora fimiseda]
MPDSSNSPMTPSSTALHRRRPGKSQGVGNIRMAVHMLGVVHRPRAVDIVPDLRFSSRVVGTRVGSTLLSPAGNLTTGRDTVKTVRGGVIRDGIIRGVVVCGVVVCGGVVCGNIVCAVVCGGVGIVNVDIHKDALLHVDVCDQPELSDKSLEMTGNDIHVTADVAAVYRNTSQLNILPFGPLFCLSTIETLRAQSVWKLRRPRRRHF